MQRDKLISLSDLNVVRISRLSLMYVSGLRRRLFIREASELAVVSLPATLENSQFDLKDGYALLHVHEKSSIHNDFVL